MRQFIVNCTAFMHIVCIRAEEGEASMNEILLLGGLAVAGLSVAVGIICAFMFALSKRRLNSTMDDEYGKS